MKPANICGVLIAAALILQAQPPRFVIEATGTERASPDLIYLLMKMEYDAGQARDATARVREHDPPGDDRSVAPSDPRS